MEGLVVANGGFYKQKNMINYPNIQKGDPQMLYNYRPVSVIPIFGKIFEKFIYNRLYSFFSAMNVIYDKQFGFRKNHSTTYYAVNYSVNHLLNEI